MGTEVGRIVKEFLFKALVREEVPISLHGNRAEFQARVVGLSDQDLEIEVTDGDRDGLSSGDDLRVFFHYQEKFHTFNSSVAENSERVLLITQPRNVYRNVERKFERIRNPHGIELVFTVRDKNVELNFPKSLRYDPEERPAFAADFEAQTLSDLVEELRAKAEPEVSEHRIVMLRDRAPRDVLERAIVATGRTVWVPATSDEFPFFDPFPQPFIVLRDDLDKMETNGEPWTGAYFLSQRALRGIYSEVACPVLYHQYVAGYVHLFNNDELKQRISTELVDWTRHFAKIVCYSLISTGYFRGDSEEEDISDGTIFDMSASGLLFAYPAANVTEVLEAHSHLDLTLKSDEREIAIGAHVTRKSKDQMFFYYGVEFARIAPDDFRYLFQFLYGKPFSEEYESILEGGAEGQDAEDAI